jgi:uncharacterized protein YdcH (DUF465 family)
MRWGDGYICCNDETCFLRYKIRRFDEHLRHEPHHEATQDSLREQRLVAWREMASIVRQCDGETRMLSPAEKARFDVLSDELDSLDSRIADASGVSCKG